MKYQNSKSNVMARELGFETIEKYIMDRIRHNKSNKDILEELNSVANMHNLTFNVRTIQKKVAALRNAISLAILNKSLARENQAA